MPAIIPFIPLIVAGVGATVGGLEIAGVGQPNQQAIQRQQEAQLNQAKLQQLQQNELASQNAIKGSLANAQEQGGGALNAPSLLELGTSIAGLPGEAGTSVGQNALGAYLGSGGTGTPGSTGAATPSSTSGNLSEMIQQLLSRGGSSSGSPSLSGSLGLSGSQEG